MFTPDYLIPALVEDALRTRRREADEARLASRRRGEGPAPVTERPERRRRSAVRRLRLS